MTFLAGTFKKLANDPRWPEAWNEATPFYNGLETARLALVVVEKMEGAGIDFEFILNNEGIDSSHYTNVKKRVEECKDG